MNGRAFRCIGVPFDDGTFERLDLKEILPLRQRVAAIKRKFKPDLVHVGLTGPSLFLHNFTAGQFPSPTMITLHVAPVETEFGKNKPVHETLRAANWVVAVSHAMAREIRRRLPELTGRCSVIHNALPEPAAPPTPVSFVPPRLLCVGRVTEQKGFDTAVAAMPAVRQAFPDAQLVIAGDGDASESLGELARRLNVSDCVRMLGWTPTERRAGVDRLGDAGIDAIAKGSRSGWSRCRRANGAGCAWPRMSMVCPKLCSTNEPGCCSRRTSRSNGQMRSARCSATRASLRWAGRRRRFVSRQFSLTQHVDAYESLYQQLAGSAARCRRRSHEQPDRQLHSRGLQRPPIPGRGAGVHPCPVAAGG